MLKIRSYAAGALALALLAQPATAETYSIDQVHSSVSFSIRHLVGRTSGNFADFSGSISYDEAAPTATSFAGTVQIGSIDTASEKRDGHLKSADFFDAEKHPTMSFASTSVASAEAGLQVTGNFTLHGITKVITIPLEVLGVAINPMTKKPVAGFSSEFVIKRSDFGVNSWIDQAGVMGDEVKITLLIEAGAVGE